MSLGDYMIIGVIVLWAVAAFIYMKRRRKQGKCIGCGGGCCDCSHRRKKSGISLF